MSILAWPIICTILIPALFYLYLRKNDQSLTHSPPELEALSPMRLTADMARAAFAEPPVELEFGIGGAVPGLQRTGRRYIVVGGAGFVGGWIVIHLLQRGEDPKNIRVLDIHRPSRADLTTGLGKDVDFVKVDMSDAPALTAAFQAPWPPSSSPSDCGITVFHTAANIRFYERHPALLPRSARVNIRGTQNVVDAARSIGVSILVHTSSASVGVRSNRFLLWPWETQPKHYVQALNDDNGMLPKRHEDFCSNYSATKVVGEGVVRGANGTRSGERGGVIRTGCVRPGNGIFGPGGDTLCGAFLVQKNNPTWASAIVQNFTYVKNCSLAHLCYERRLLDLENGSSNPDISGQAFTICDPNPPLNSGSIHTVLETLDGETRFYTLSPTFMLLVAHIVECIYLARNLLGLSSLSLLRTFSRLIPEIKGDIVKLQPSLFNLVQVHLVFDDSRARLAPEKGGLGYEGVYTTLQGLCETVREHKKMESEQDGRGLAKSMNGGVGLGWGPLRTERAAARVGEKMGVL